MVCSPVTDADFDVESYLGGITRNASGTIISAGAVLFTYFMQGTNESNTDYVSEDEV